MEEGAKIARKTIKRTEEFTMYQCIFKTIV